MIPAPCSPATTLEGCEKTHESHNKTPYSNKDDEQGYHYNRAIQRIRQDGKTCDNTENTEKDFVSGIRAIYCQTKQRKQAADKPVGTEYGDQYKESPVWIVKEEYPEDKGDNSLD